MGQIKVTTATVRKKNPSKAQPKIEARRVIVNNQVQKLHTAAAASKRPATTHSAPKQVSRSKTTRTASKQAVKRLSTARSKQNKRR